MSNIKVCLRIKPQLSDDIQPQLPVLIKKNESSNKLYFKHRNDTKIFTFDEIYTPEIKNEEVYNSLKEDLIGSALQGVLSPVNLSSITVLWHTDKPALVKPIRFLVKGMRIQECLLDLLRICSLTPTTLGFGIWM